ncbi:MFS transporter [Nocardioides sp. Iso805N]|uniref:MFS transporter n=1 Tax=Nocardioides sp. Iso805N TaxID=1283287 RepID=UPI0003721FBC|nr:MFS transporter [Nocardioides sp. Iso805N]
MRRFRVPLLALTVGLVLADSAVVTLALPAILQRLHGTVPQIAWVLISFNLVLALCAVPAARLCDRFDPRICCAAGIALFAAASAACALAGSMELLIAARSVQALGGAFALVGSLELLVSVEGETRGVGWWIAAGVVGTAAGPVVGGLLTEAISWQAIFVVQVPVAILAVPAALSIRPVRTPTPQRHPPALAPNLALALLSAALTAALFLLVLLLVEGWRHSPAAAALTVSVIPLAAAAARPLVRRLGATPRMEAVAGSLLIAGGLVALALPPSAHLAWTIAPQALIGLGLGMTVDRLTAAALRDRLPRAVHGGWTIAARHFGVVAGLLVLTPVFTASLEAAQGPAQEAVTALVLDAPLQAGDKVAIAHALSDRLADQHDQVPDLRPAFRSLDIAPEDRPAADDLERALDDQVRRAATRAFRDSFLIAGALALLALIPLSVRRRSR